MKLTIKVFFFLLLSIKTHALIIKEFKLSGNDKTKKAAIIRYVNMPLGKEISQEQLNFTIEKIRRLSQLNILNISFKEGVLELTVDEKWSFFPVPVISQSNNYYSRGLLLYDNNFFGRLGTGAAGVFWTNSGINGLLYWQEDNIISDNIGMKVILLHKNDLTQFRRGNKTQKEFETRVDSIILSPNYIHGNFDHKLGPIFFKRKVYEEERKVFDDKRYGLYYRQHYKGFKQLPLFYDGYNLDYDLFVFNKGDSFDIQTKGEILYIKPYEADFLKYDFHFNYTNASNYLNPEIQGGSEGFRGYDKKSLPTQWNVGAFFEYQKHISHTLYSSLFYEYNYSKLISPVAEGKKLSESTIGINTAYYFQTISIPGVILEYGYNIDDQSHHVLFNIGLKL